MATLKAHLTKDRLWGSEQPGLAQNCEADGGMGETWVQKLPQHKPLTVWRPEVFLPFLVPPTPALTASGRCPQNNFSLPELQCFISDSQLTRDAALHLRLGDRRGPAQGGRGQGGQEAASAPPAPPLRRLYPTSPGPGIRTLWDQISTFLLFIYLFKELYGNEVLSPF